MVADKTKRNLEKKTNEKTPDKWQILITKSTENISLNYQLLLPFNIMLLRDAVTR